MKKTIILNILLISGLMLAGCATETPTVEPTATIFSRMEIVTATPVTPTATETPIPTETPTITPSPEPPTETPTITPTQDPLATVIPTTAVVELPRISPRSETNCRKQPKQEAAVIGFFVTGQTAVVQARDEFGVWYLIDNPTTDYDPGCWVWSGNVDLTGDLNVVPVYTLK